MEYPKNHKINVTYKLFVNTYKKEEPIIKLPYGASNMYPASLTKDDITFHHDPTRVLGRIDKTAHTTPKKVICSGPVTTVIFEDGTKSQVRCSEDDSPYNDYEKAFMMAWLYQLVGKKNVRKVLKDNQDVFDNSEETNSIVNALNNIRFMFNGRKIKKRRKNMTHLDLFIITFIVLVSNGLVYWKLQQEIKEVHNDRKSYQLAIMEQVCHTRNDIANMHVLITKVIHNEFNSVSDDLKYLPNKINDDYLRIAEETWRLHNRITKLEIDKHIVQKDLLNKTYNEKRAQLGLDPIESCDTKYVEDVELVDDEEVFK